MLTKLKIKNFKALREAEFKMAPLVLLTGMNAVGKSSMIQVLLLLESSIKRSRGFWNGLHLKGDSHINLGLGRDVFSIGAPADESLFFELEWDFDKILILNFEQRLSTDVLPIIDNTSNSEILEDDNLYFIPPFKKLQYLSANRINPEIRYPTSPYYIDERKSLGNEGEYTVHYLAQYQDRDISNLALLHPKAKSTTLLDNVSAWMGDISPGVKVNATYYEELEAAILGYSFENQYGYTDEFKPTNVGFGLTYVLPIVTALLIAPRDSMVIIENPESHLHPAGQSRIGQLCALAAASGIQVILESHSDHVLNGLRVAVHQGSILPEDVAIYYFQRENNSPDHKTEIKSIFIDKKGRIDEWPVGFFDEWDKQLDVLLQ